MSGLAPVGAPTQSAIEARARIEADGRPGIWIEVLDQDALVEAAARVEARMAEGADLPLAGLSVAVKNNIDVRGLRTTAGCPTFGAVASRHAPAVQALVDAGAVVVGATNLDQFATGLVGTRSPYGICPNAHWDGRVSGGSSSGSAVAVAAGHVDLGVGTDTAGSGRVPAAANGIFGWKPTRRLVPTDGVVPACASLDCVAYFARDTDVLGRVATVVESAAGGAHGPEPSDGDSGRPLRLGIPELRTLDFDGDAAGPARHAAALDAVLAGTGAQTAVIDLDPFLAVGRLLYEGAFVRERHEAVGAFVAAHPNDVDPVVRGIIEAAGTIPIEALVRDRADVAIRREALGPVWDEVDALLVPSIPRLPTVAEVAAAPIAVNAMLGTYTNFVNLLGLCAVTFPVGPPTASGPPTSITAIAAPGRDRVLLGIAAALGAPARDPR